MITIRQYYAAHAPNVPGYFKRKYETKTVAVEYSPGKYQLEGRTTWESDIDYLCRWKFYYADKMIAASNEVVDIKE